MCSGLCMVLYGVRTSVKEWQKVVRGGLLLRREEYVANGMVEVIQRDKMKPFLRWNIP